MKKGQQAEEVHATWVEEEEVDGNSLTERVRELIQDEYVRRLVIRNADDEMLVDVPLSMGMIAGGFMSFLVPGLIPLGAAAVFFQRIKIQVVRSTE